MKLLGVLYDVKKPNVETMTKCQRPNLLLYSQTIRYLRSLVSCRASPEFS
jgi:hypothetical protein